MFNQYEKLLCIINILVQYCLKGILYDCIHEIIILNIYDKELHYIELGIILRGIVTGH